MKKFHDEKEEYVKKIIHFHCKCKEKHLLLVCLCDKRPYSSDLQYHMEKECNCAFISGKGFCNFCRWVSYLLNFEAYKVCAKRMPKCLKDNVTNTHKYFQKLKSEPFFRFENNSNSFTVFSDNPQELALPKIVD